jgi:hypothetical protein
MDGLDRGGQDLVDAAPDVRAGTAGDDGELAEELEVALAAIALEGVLAGRDAGEGMGAGASGSGMTASVAGAPSNAMAVPAGCPAVAGSAGRGREKPLEVTQAIAAVATWVDPVIAEPSGVAPRPNRVRMDAQKPRGLRDGEGCVGGSRRN